MQHSWPIRPLYDYYRLFYRTDQLNSAFQRICLYEYKNSTTNSTWIPSNVKNLAIHWLKVTFPTCTSTTNTITVILVIQATNHIYHQTMKTNIAANRVNTNFNVGNVSKSSLKILISRWVMNDTEFMKSNILPIRINPNQSPKGMAMIYLRINGTLIGSVCFI